MAARRTATRAALAGLAVGVALGAAGRRRSRERSEAALGGHRGRPVTVTVDDGVQLAVDIEEAGSPEFAVVFAHGWTMNRHCWHFQREAFKGRGTLVFYDQRGHGGSAAGAPGACTIDRLGDDLAAVIERAVPEGLPVVLVGHSMGGMTIMAFAERHPGLLASRVAGVALLSTSSGRLRESTFGLPGPVGRLAPVVTPIVFDRLRARAELIDRSVALRTRTNLPVTRYVAFGPGARRDHVRFVTEMVATTPTEVMVGFFNDFLVHDKSGALAALGSVETLVMVGARDRLTPKVHSHRIAEAVPGARLQIVPGAGHMIGLERPEVVNAALSGLFDRALRRAAGRARDEAGTG
ncbi:alpha/beta hydrolase [Planomonospora sp. ID91781]|uniref:Alpha/beta hydrolase n=1 Tax=Planomonospora sphaerica TaxID=161355 RepID=A0A171DD26_9ACTN|nr:MULTISPECIES: alpha/beta hydrolase [Planomonospora]MBG0820306.1 alpha/beta hydrolase [Planomonospora sp. ID91781]GAT68022.1 alpha/beta hydrolase [Planomonospora sphaerica]